MLSRLAAAGIFVMLDMHTLRNDANHDLWCAESTCNEENEAPLWDAWTVLAERYCAPQPSPARPHPPRCGLPWVRPSTSEP